MLQSKEKEALKSRIEATTKEASELIAKLNNDARYNKSHRAELQTLQKLINELNGKVEANIFGKDEEVSRLAFQVETMTMDSTVLVVDLDESARCNDLQKVKLWVMQEYS